MISSSTKSIAIILARLNSSRLPRKQLRLINGKPMIDHIIERLSEVKGIDQLILATGPKEENEDLARQVHSYGIKTFFDDDVNDVTGRIARAGECFKAGFIVTVSGDCPLIDPEFIQRGIALLKDSEADFVYVDHLKYKCLHEGIEFHTKENWETLDELSSTWYHKEHPGSVLKEGNHSFRGAEITPRVEFQRHDFRMSVDTRSDLFFMNQIYQELSSDDKIVDLHDVLNLIDKKPWLKKINDHVHQKEVEEKSKTFLFITQASPEIGMGHLSRCIALATEIQESYGAKTIFYLNSDEIALTILKQQGFIVSLESQLGPKTDILAIVQMNKISRIIVDIKPDILYSRFDFLPRMYSPIVLIDILPEGEFSGIPSVIPAVNLDRQARPKNVYRGKKYLILKREIQFWGDAQNDVKPDQILVLSGGSSIPKSQIIKSLEIFENNVTIKFIIGPFANREWLESELNDTDIFNYNISQSPEQIFSDIKKAYLVLTPFGVTAYECLAIGTPTVITSIVNPDDQDIIEYLEQENILVNVLENSNSAEQMGRNIYKLYSDPEKCESLSEKARANIQADGVKNVANIIVSNI